MKNTVGYIITTLLTIFMIVITVSIINVFSVINKANSYHQTCIAEIQASNYSASIISKYQNDTGDFRTSIVDRTVSNMDENLEKTGRIYEVTTSYTIEIPIINYQSTKVLHGYAR